MQAEIAALATPVPVAILGINSAGSASGNALMVAGRVLPWLQDDATHDVWALWAVAYRDVVVLDVENRVVSVYNLTANDLADPARYAELKALLIAAAGM